MLTSDWKTASLNNGTCVEVRCGNGACVEVRSDGGGVQVRDSKDPDGPVLTFTGPEWEAFIGGAKDGEFDL